MPWQATGSPRWAHTWMPSSGSSAEVVQVEHGAALVSGTAGLHLALVLLGVESGDDVFCSAFTFAASAFAITYVGAMPVFIDSDLSTWNMDPALLAEELELAAARGRLPKAVIVVDLYGQSADWEPILEAAGRYGVPVIEDAAEALGASYRDKPVGGFGRLGVFSFNGNKIITTSGGGMLVSNDEALVRRARFLASQARDSAPHYEHSAIGYNYRLSNILAAVGRGQLRVLESRVAARRRNFDLYRKGLEGLPGISFMPEAPFGRCTRWLTCLTIEPARFGATREDVRIALEAENIEARPVWKPMQLQPVFDGFQFVGRGVSERLFRDGLCLPSGSGLRDDQIDRVVSIVSRCCRAC